MLLPAEESALRLKKEIIDRQELYLVAAAGTSSEEWTKRQFAIFIDERKYLPAFVSREAAAAFAGIHGCTIDGDALVILANKKTFGRMVGEYSGSGLISRIRVYATPPVGIDFDPGELLENSVVSESDIMEDPTPEKQFKGTDEVRRVLDTYETNARKKLDPGARYETINTLIQSLAQRNNIDPNDLDKALGLVSGYSRNFFVEVRTSRPSKEVVLKYLSFFGLAPYLYLFKKDCLELHNYLRNHKVIDRYRLKTSPSIGAERFVLQKIQRGMDGGFYVYKLTIKSKEQQMQIVVSNPLNLQVGREYQLLNGDGTPRTQDEGSGKESDPLPMPGEESLRQLVKDLTNQTVKSKPQSTERSYEELRMDAIIGYFRKRNVDGPTAKSMYRNLEVEPDILDEFYKYVTLQQFSSLDIQGYTAKRLIKNLKMSPYDAFLTLVKLRSDPKGTKQWLVYRETDPQYQ